MFEGGVLPRLPAGGAAGTLGASAEDAPADSVVASEEVAGLLGSLAAGGELAGVVEGLLAHLLVTAQDPNDDEGDGGGECSDTDGAGSVDDEGLFAGDSGGDTALVAGAEGHRVVSVEEAGATGVLGLGVWGLGELVAACHRLAAWASWGQSLAAACLTACGELSAHPGQWGPDGRVSSVVGFEERRFNTTCLLSARLGVSRSRAGQIVDHGSALMNTGFNPTEVMERCGVLDAAKASLVTRRLEGVPAPVALAVQERVLPQAPRRSVSQVGRDIERALMETDPTGHAERVRVNQERRCVSRPRPAGEGLSQVRLLLPTMDALLLDATLDAIAASARACGDRRSPAQLRADAITAMTLSTLRTSQQTAYRRPTQAPDDDTPASTNHDNNNGADDGSLSDTLGGTGGRVISGGLTSSLSDGTGGGDVTGGFGGGLDGVSELTAPLAPSSSSASPRRLLPDGVPLEGLLGTLSSLVGSTSPWWTPSGTGHLPLPKNIHIDVQVTVPLTSLVGLAPPGDSPTGSGDPGGSKRIDDSEPARRTLPGSSGRSLPEPDPAAPVSQPATSCSAAPVSQPAVSLSAAATGVAQVRIGARSAAVPALTAWALAAGGTWRRLVTDPASGTVLDVRRSRYRPPAPAWPTWCAPATGPASSPPATPPPNAATSTISPPGARAGPPAWTTSWSCARPTTASSTPPDGHSPETTPAEPCPGTPPTRPSTNATQTAPSPAYPTRPDPTSTVIAKNLSQQINPDILNRLNQALDRAPTNQAHNHAGLGTNPNSSTSPRLATHGPQPGHKPGALETTPYPKAAHTLQLAPLID